jgi:hypothetical protein
MDFISTYDPRPDSHTIFFEGKLSKFRAFAYLCEASGLSKVLNLRVRELQMYQENQILVLLDIGGSILYRHKETKKVSGIEREPDFMVRKHYHYFRPHFQEFIGTLLEHPRVRLAFYTSITKKNALPLLFHVFESPMLKRLKGNLFELFDQDYN